MGGCYKDSYKRLSCCALQRVGDANVPASFSPALFSQLRRNLAIRNKFNISFHCDSLSLPILGGFRIDALRSFVVRAGDPLWTFAPSFSTAQVQTFRLLLVKSSLCIPILLFV